MVVGDDPAFNTCITPSRSEHIIVIVYLQVPGLLLEFKFILLWCFRPRSQGVLVGREGPDFQHLAAALRHPEGVLCLGSAVVGEVGHGGLLMSGRIGRSSARSAMGAAMPPRTNTCICGTRNQFKVKGFECEHCPYTSI